MRFLLSLCVCVAFLLPQISEASSDPIKIIVNKKNIDLKDSAPFIDGTSGRTMVPIRFISESLGAEVVWDERARQIHLLKGRIPSKLRLVKKWPRSIMIRSIWTARL
ncbi:hypothetical protein BEP19_00665 [Ammoniphilus oxalaticus]|uniref:Copper amine oxidase-like N-terminal domain-containing protein n=1 Tax=Ammoniphilus oxalaticus TaxID=66863 RepID=A0A419SRE1_9BACL|nr:hypothetical protein BEP19_00665 [Ammoniphilus oxalaticus]